MDDPEVLIVGAGPSGLALALWLTRLGVRARIIDKNAEAAPFSRALGVQARTLEFYRQLDTAAAAANTAGTGLADAMVQGGVKADGINFWVRGRKAARVRFGHIGDDLSPFPFVLMFAQDAHERLLLARLDALGVRVERQTELLRFEQQTDKVRAVLKGADGAEEICEAAYLAGCDGAHSVVRQALATSFGGGTYSRLFYVADVVAGGPPIDNELHVELDAADLLAIFPMKGNCRVRLVGTVRDEMVAPERELTFEDVSDRAMKRLKLVVEKVNWFSSYRVHHRVAGRFRQGRAFLVGDAAHIHSPVGAQGMNTGIGDAVNLAWKLAAVLQRGAPDTLLDSYESERIPFARRLVRTTDQIFTVATNPGVIPRRIRTRVMPLVMPLLLRLNPLRRFLFLTISQLSIHYRKSALSFGKVGKLHGGDRLPWVQLAEGGDNFAPLASLNWQVHIYGEVKSGLDPACAELALPLHAFVWQPEMKRAGFKRAALYLVRPDGYIGLVDGNGDANGLREYFYKRGLHGGSRG